MRLLVLVIAVLIGACSGQADDRAPAGQPPRALPIELAAAKLTPGEIPGANTEIGRVARFCSKPLYCGELGFMDCGSAVDGPSYYFERKSGKIRGVCGGACMLDRDGHCKRDCPPAGWACRPDRGGLG